jgi:signal transduction histidine kinase
MKLALRARITAWYFSVLQSPSLCWGEPGSCGLGLAIGHGIAEKGGGTIKVHRTRGSGSIFRLHSPLAANL